MNTSSKNIKAKKWLSEPKCTHCGYNKYYQPPRESGCNHVHYPEGCEICNDREELKRPNIIISKEEYELLLKVIQE